jgi:hypothetical protein
VGAKRHLNYALYMPARVAFICDQTGLVCKRRNDGNLHHGRSAERARLAAQMIAIALSRWRHYTGLLARSEPLRQRLPEGHKRGRSGIIDNDECVANHVSAGFDRVCPQLPRRLERNSTGVIQARKMNAVIVLDELMAGFDVKVKARHQKPPFPNASDYRFGRKPVKEKK